MSKFEQKTAIINYWRAIELFSPQSIPQAMPNDATEPVFSVIETALLPWHPDHPFQKRFIPALLHK